MPATSLLAEQHRFAQGRWQLLYNKVDNIVVAGYPPLVAIATPQQVLGTADARRALPTILEGFRRDGEHAEPVFIGAYRQPEAVLIPAALADRLAPLIEDLLLADRIRERLAASEQPIDGDDVVRRLGLDENEIADEVAALLQQRPSTER